MHLSVDRISVRIPTRTRPRLLSTTRKWLCGEGVGRACAKFLSECRVATIRPEHSHVVPSRRTL